MQKQKTTWLRKITYVLFSLMAVTFLCVFYLTATSSGLQTLASTISRLASNADQQIKISGISGIWSGETSVQNILVSDRAGEVARINTVRLIWDRGSLLSFKLNAESLQVGQIDLLRLPAAGESSGKPFSLPLQLDIQSFEIDALHLSDALARTDAKLHIAGKIKAEISPQNISGTLMIDRAERPDDLLSAEFSYSPSTDQISLQVGYFEKSDGILASLMELPGSPELAAKISASGSLESLKLQVLAEADRKNVLKLDGTLQKTDGTTRLILAGNGKPSELVPPKFRELLDGPLNIDIDAARSDEGVITVNRAKIDTNGFFAAATGSFDPAGNNDISGGLTAKAAAVNLTGIIPGINNLAPKSLAFQINGPADKSRVEVSTDIPLIDLQTTQIYKAKAYLLSEDFDFGKGSGTFQANGSAQSVRHINEDLNRLLDGELYFETTGAITTTAITWDVFHLQNAGINAVSKGQYDLAERTAIAGLDATVKHSTLPEASKQLLKNNVTLHSAFSLTNQGEMELNDIKLVSDGFSVEGSGSYWKDEITSKLSLALADVAVLSPGATGAITGDLEVSGPLDAAKIDLVLNAPKIGLEDQTITDLSVQLQGTASPSSPDLALKIDGAINGLPLTGGTTLNLVNGTRVLQAIDLKTGSNILSGSFALDAAGMPTGKINFDFPDIAPLAALALQKADGAVTGNILFSAEGETPTATLTLSAPQITFEDNRLQNISGEVKLDNYATKPTVSGKATIGGINSGGTQIGSTILTFARDEDWTGFNINTTVNGTLPVKAAGRLKSLNGKTSLELKTVNAAVEDIPVALGAPTLIEIENGQVSLREVLMEVGGGQANISGTAGNDLSLDVRLARLNSAVVNQFAPNLQAAGSISGNVSIKGKAANPEIDFKLDWANASTVQTREAGLGGMQINADGSLANKLLRYRSTLVDRSGLRFSGGGSVKLETIPVLDLGYNGDVPFAVLAATFNDKGLSLTGMAKADVKITGSATKPAFSGIVRSGDARFVHAESGIAIEKINLAIVLDGQRARIETLRGNISTGGQISIDGNVSLEGDLPADINVFINKGVYADGRSVNTRFDAALKLAGPLVNDPVLSGKVTLAKTVITVPETVPTSISRLDVQHKNASAAVENQASSLVPKATSSSSGIVLDLQINAANQIFVRGRGIDAELGGALRLAGNLASPSAVGGFDLRRGRLSILGKRLNFTRGQISFAGSLLPELDLVAENQSDDTTIIVQVSGPANAPQFKFSSVPSLAEDEVLARLIFNRNIGNLSPLQIVQLGQAVATLTGTGGNSSLLDKFQKLIKVDDLDVKTDSKTGETSVGVGRYVNDKTYVGVERGSTAGTGKATIDLNIGRGVKLRGEATETGKNKAGIFYEKEY